MPMNLRPRQQAAPADHNYCFVPGLPVYDLRQTPRSYGVSVSFAYRHQVPASKPKSKRKKMPKEQKARLRQKRIYSYFRSRKLRRRSPRETTKNSKVSENIARSKIKKEKETDDDTDDGNLADSAIYHSSDEEAGPSVDSSHKHCSMCSQCGKHWKRRKHTADDEHRRHSERLVVKNYKLPFDQLPVVVKLRVFEYLTPQERGIVAVVCKEWAYLLRSPRLWSKLDLSCFNPPVQRIKHHPSAKPFQFSWFTTVQDYMAYKQRMSQFCAFLRDLQPRLSSFSMCFDIANQRDLWLDQVSELLDDCQCRDLTRLNVNWTLTPVQPPCIDTFCCLFNKVRFLVHLHFERIRKFHAFLKKITMKACHLQQVRLPFDWSPRSVLLLCRLAHLRSLTLQRYINFKGLSQELLNTLFRSLPELQYLTLEVVNPVYSSQQLYRIEHCNLVMLDLSWCKGFFLQTLITPQLRVFKTARHPWHGPLVARATNTIPCLYDLLHRGAPRLTQVNKHKLHGYWLEYMYDELDYTLERVCPCKYHWTEFRADPNANNANANNANNHNVNDDNNAA